MTRLANCPLKYGIVFYLLVQKCVPFSTRFVVYFHPTQMCNKTKIKVSRNFNQHQLLKCCTRVKSSRQVICRHHEGPPLFLRLKVGNPRCIFKSRDDMKDNDDKDNDDVWEPHGSRPQNNTKKSQQFPKLKIEKLWYTTEVQSSHEIVCARTW